MAGGKRSAHEEDMAGLALRHVPLSRSTRVLWLLGEIGCDYELILLDRPEGASPWAALDPKAPPALRDGETTIHETGAMVEWLCETRAPGLWRAPGAFGRMGWLDWLHFGETLLQPLARLTGPRPAPPGPDDPDYRRLSGTLEKIEKWLAESEWLLSEFSGVDCHVGYSVWLASHYASFADRPGLAAYRDRCAARPAFRRALAEGA